MKKLYILLAIITLATACKEDIPLNADSTVGVLCANGIIYSDSDSNYLLITETGMDKARELNTALVELTVNGELVEEISVCDTIPGRYNIKTILHDGDQVRFDIHNLDKHAYFEGVMPKKVENLEVSYDIEKDKTYREYYDDDPAHADMFRFNVSFDDISPEKHYYRLNPVVNCTVSFYDSYSVWFSECYVDHNGHITRYKEKNDNSLTLVMQFVSPKLIYDGELLLTDENFAVDNDFMDGTYNDCHVFKNSRFAGGRCNMKYYEKANLTYSYSSEKGYGTQSVLIPETVEFYHRDSSDLYEYGLLKTYTYIEKVGIETIDEDAFYYYKAINSYRSGTFDYQELTGAIKMHTNVNGGSGNIILTARAEKTFAIYNHVTPKPVYVQLDDEPEPDYIFYKGE